jgi:hypothetical protein
MEEIPRMDRRIRRIDPNRRQNLLVPNARNAWRGSGKNIRHAEGSQAQGQTKGGTEFCHYTIAHGIFSERIRAIRKIDHSLSDRAEESLPLSDAFSAARFNALFADRESKSR